MIFLQPSTPTPQPISAGDLERAVHEVGNLMANLISQGVGGFILAFMLMLVFIVGISAVVLWKLGYLRPRTVTPPNTAPPPLMDDNKAAQLITGITSLSESFQIVYETSSEREARWDKERSEYQATIAKFTEAITLLTTTLQARAKADELLIIKIEDVLKIVKESEGIGATVDVIKKTSDGILDSGTKLTLYVSDIELLLKTIQAMMEKLKLRYDELSIVSSQLSQKKRETTDQLTVIKPDDSKPLPPLTPSQEVT